MDDLLDRLREANPPRDPALCQRVAERFEPGWSIALRGMLFVPIIGSFVLTALGLPLVAILNKLGYEHDNTVQDVAVLVLLVATLASSLVLFRLWIRKKRDRARACGRDGALYTARFGNYITYRGVRFYEVAFELGHVRIGIPIKDHPGAGDETFVLATRDYPYGLAFDTKNRPQAGRIRSRR